MFAPHPKPSSITMATSTIFIPPFMVIFFKDLMFGFSTFEAELADVILVIKTSIFGTRIIGRLCAGERV
ncbi:hypothetical protein ACS0TY_023938 [Phlomoides rotata]